MAEKRYSRLVDFRRRLLWCRPADGDWPPEVEDSHCPLVILFGWLGGENVIGRHRQLASLSWGQPPPGLLFVFSAERPEMGEGEALVIFQSIAEEVVEADMGKPDQRAINRKRDMRKHAVDRKCERPYDGMHGIVYDSAHARPAEVAGKGEIRCEKEGGIKPPARSDVAIQGCCGGEQRPTLETQQQQRLPGDGRRGGLAGHDRWEGVRGD